MAVTSHRKERPCRAGWREGPAISSVTCWTHVSPSSHAVVKFMDVYQRSYCRPIETLVDIFQEYPDEIEFIFKPSCVPLMRCGGCCNDESLECVPTEEFNITMQVGTSREPGWGRGGYPQALAPGVPWPFPGQLLKGGARLALPSSCCGVSQGEMRASDPLWRKRCLCF